MLDRCHYIEELNSMLDTITLEYPFLKEHDCTVSNAATSEQIVQNLINKLVCRWCIELDAWNISGRSSCYSSYLIVMKNL